MTTHTATAAGPGATPLMILGVVIAYLVTVALDRVGEPAAGSPTTT